MTVRPLTILAAAVALTGLNAVKPAVVDDTAYLFFARHLAEKPLDPYGWQLFWYEAPQSAMQILLPPVLPYWLAVGIRLFGEHLFLLKLWLFPFAWLLCGAVAALLARFGSGAERPLFLVFVCSPAVLPLFNFMLDIPALSLGAAAVAMFVGGTDRKSFWPKKSELSDGLRKSLTERLLRKPFAKRSIYPENPEFRVHDCDTPLQRGDDVVRPAQAFAQDSKIR